MHGFISECVFVHHGVAVEKWRHFLRVPWEVMTLTAAIGLCEWQQVLALLEDMKRLNIRETWQIWVSKSHRGFVLSGVRMRMMRMMRMGMNIAMVMMVMMMMMMMMRMRMRIRMVVVMMLHVVRGMLLLMLVMTVLMMSMVLTVLRQTWWHPPQWSQLAHVVASGWRQGDDSHNLLILLSILIHFAHFGSLLLAHPWKKWKLRRPSTCLQNCPLSGSFQTRCRRWGMLGGPGVARSCQVLALFPSYYGHCGMASDDVDVLTYVDIMLPYPCKCLFFLPYPVCAPEMEHLMYP